MEKLKKSLDDIENLLKVFKNNPYNSWFFLSLLI